MTSISSRISGPLSILTALFATSLLAQDTHTLTVTPVGPGTVSWDPVKESYDTGDTVTITATPNEGCYLEFIEGKIEGRTQPWRTTQKSTTVTIGAETAGEWFAWFNTGEVIWREDFESEFAARDWTAEGGLWEINSTDTIYGPGYSFEGNRCSTTNAEGEYPENASASFKKFRAVTLPEIEGTDSIHLSFFQYYALGWDDYVQFSIRIEGKDWSNLHTVRAKSQGWVKRSFDISTYSGNNVEIRFRLKSARVRDSHGNYRTSVGPGWSVDLVEIVREDRSKFAEYETFENGHQRWSSNGQWQIGQPPETVGTESGSFCVGTSIRGNYNEDRFYSGPYTLASPWIRIATADEHPAISYAQWFQIAAGDNGRIFVDVDGDPTHYQLGSDTVGSGMTWSPRILPLGMFGGQRVRVFFELRSSPTKDSHGYQHSNVGLGWYIDDLAIFPTSKMTDLTPAYAISASIGDFYDEVRVTWKDLLKNETPTYEVWRGISTNRQSSGELLKSGVRGLLFQDRTAKIGKQYFYWVRAQRDAQLTEFSSWATGYRDVQMPEDLKASAGNLSDRVFLSWARVPGAETYDIFRTPGLSSENGEVIASDIAVNEFGDFSVLSGSDYEYRIRAVASGRKSEWSGSETGYCVEFGITTLVASDGLLSDRIRLSWKGVDDADSYVIYRSDIPDRFSASVLVEHLTSPAYEDFTGLESKQYFYWVRALVKGDPSEFSNRDSGYRRAAQLGDLIAWGDNTFDKSTLPDGNLSNVIGIAAGLDHNLALRSDGTVLGWGRDFHGQATPPTSLADVVDIAVGYDHSLALKRDGTVVGWGRDLFGKTTVPENLGFAVDIAAGGDHSMALLANGTVIAWGGNDYGQSDVPAGLRNVVEIAAGGFHSIARQVDGKIVVWGDNSYDQLNVPAGIRRALRIAAGWNHCLVITPEGTVDAWGDDRQGQTDVPASVSASAIRTLSARPRDGTVRITSIDGGLSYSLALTADGQFLAWGDNSSSQTTKPEGVTSLSQITAGEANNVALVGQPDAKILSVIPAFADVEPGTDLLLQVRASGGADLAYQWFFNGRPIRGETAETLLLKHPGADAAGSYSVDGISGGETVRSADVAVAAEDGIGSERMGDGTWRIWFHATQGRKCYIDASADLENWNPVLTVEVGDGLEHEHFLTADDFDPRLLTEDPSTEYTNPRLFFRLRVE